jgi:glycosyltransferase involved in cell wall biosynthesis
MASHPSRLAPSISAVVPVYNAELSLDELVARLSSVLPTITSRWEIILVNDGSADGSWPVIERLAAASAHVVGIDLARNSGQHNALLAGIRAAQCDVIVTLDDDLQNPPEEIPKLIAGLGTGFDVMYGVPEKLSHDLWRNVTSTITKWSLAQFMGAETARNISGFRAFRTVVRAAFADYRSALVSIDVLLTWGTSRFGMASVAHHPRRHGRSNYGVVSLLTHTLNMLTGFGTAPLRLASYGGFVFILFGIIALLFVVIRYMVQGTTAPGFPFLASIVILFSGVQLFALGIIGEYVSRVHFRLTDRPSYTIRMTVREEVRQPDGV